MGAGHESVALVAVRMCGYRGHMTRPLRSCPHCRALLEPDEPVCPYCGYQIEVTARRQAAMDAPETQGLWQSTWIVGTCILVFLLETMATMGALGGGGLQRVLFAVPARILLTMGARNGSLILEGEWWRLIVPVFMHGGLLHLLFNSMALVQIGPLAEQAYGRSRLWLIYILSGVAGNLLGIFFQPLSIGIGASGAVFGLIGAAGLYGHRRHDTFGRLIRSIMLRWGAFSLLFGLMMQGVDNYAHIGGLLAGLGLSFLLERRADTPGAVDQAITLAAWILLAAVAAAFFLAFVGFSGR